jgi:hypothetical protein
MEQKKTSYKVASFMKDMAEKARQAPDGSIFRPLSLLVLCTGFVFVQSSLMPPSAIAGKIACVGGLDIVLFGDNNSS